jgi:hypothetical protein
MKFNEAIDHLFNWKKNPASVFLLAAPLAAIGFGLMLALALVHMVVNNDPWYLVIFGFGMALLGLSLWPIRKLIFASVTENKG